MKTIMATITMNKRVEHDVETLASLRLEENKKHDKKEVVPTNRENSIEKIQDKYEQEFERIMHEQENQQTSERGIKSEVQNCKILKDKPSVMGESRNKPSYVIQTNDVGAIIKTTPQSSRPIIKSSHTRRCIEDDYPSELNPFADEKMGKGKSTNPFGDSDGEESPDIRLVLPPQPMPRQSVSSTRPLREENNTLKLPVPLPRTVSKSMPSTPNQSPLLRANRSFRLPGSGSSLAGSNTSAYNSIRRKKKIAPPPPNVSLPTLLVPVQSPTASPKTSSRPRKARMAPLPPLIKPDMNKVQQEISPFKPEENNGHT